MDYPGTAIEIKDSKGDELFHIVVDSNANQQVLFFASDKNFRISLDDLILILQKSKDKVKYCEWEEDK